MSVSIHEENPARIIIRERGLGIARFFGLPFLGFGLYLLGMIALGLFEHIAAGQIIGWFKNIAGTLVGLVLGLLFAVPGWLLVFTRWRWIIDGVRREAELQKNFLVAKTKKIIPASDITHVKIVWEERYKYDRDKIRMAYVVALALKEGRNELITWCKELDEAQSVADKVAKLLGKNVIVKEFGEPDEDEAEDQG